MKQYLISLVFALLGAAAATADPAATAAQRPALAVRPLHIPGDPRFDYYIELLRAALEITTDQFGPYEWAAWPEDHSTRRQAELLHEGRVLNVVYSAWDKHLSKASIVVNPHIRKGVHGYRVIIIRRTDLERFRGVKIWDGLKGFRAGQGRGWPDAQIYHHNQLPIVDIAEFPRLLPMLKAGRFDYFPLGVAEAERILAQCGSACSDLTIEPHLLLHYEHRIYFQVSRKMPELANRINAGLEALIANGEFDRIWQAHHHKQIDRLNLDGRLLFTLQSPEQTPIERDPRPGLWLR